ncbi:cupin domain-containing protein [Acidicapsa dinghuensis]|uniref:Cupin domain-containing protein n=1 Tax=Acidicapsa dinghuensis TaxID=2218256 RepID=A0ABW1EJG3_9BACT|nr:cupin domain-containing protein [Acidicapsa dinghuensis]
MNRRRFVQSAALAAASPFLPDQPAAQAEPSATSLTKEGRVLPAGQDIFGVTRSLGFSHLAFKVSGTETNGNLFVLQHTGMTPGGPPLHLHFAQEEWFHVEEGEVLFQLGDKQATLKSGETVLVPRNIPHTFSAVRGPARMTIAFSPAGNMEQYFIDTAQPNLKPRDPSFYGMKLLGPPLKTT